jgi:hypothetical protein
LILIVRIDVKPNAALGEPSRGVPRNGQIAHAAAFILGIRRHIRPASAEIDAHRRARRYLTHASARMMACILPFDAATSAKPVERVHIPS